MHNVETLNICMKKFDAVKILFDKMTAFEFSHFFSFCMKKFDAIKSYFDKITSFFFKLNNFLHFVSLKGFCLCSDSAYGGKSTCTTAFVETI